VAIIDRILDRGKVINLGTVKNNMKEYERIWKINSPVYEKMY